MFPEPFLKWFAEYAGAHMLSSRTCFFLGVRLCEMVSPSAVILLREVLDRPLDMKQEDMKLVPFWICVCNAQDLEHFVGFGLGLEFSGHKTEIEAFVMETLAVVDVVEVSRSFSEVIVYLTCSKKVEFGVRAYLFNMAAYFLDVDNFLLDDLKLTFSFALEMTDYAELSFAPRVMINTFSDCKSLEEQLFLPKNMSFVERQERG
jgi:hypothetical protein